MKIVVIGAGLTGLSAALDLWRSAKHEVVLLEKESEPGGLCRTIKTEGFSYDLTGHFLHLRDSALEKEIKSQFRKEELLEVFRKSYIYIDRSTVPYPFQSNIYYLSPEKRKECLLSFFENLKANQKNVVPSSYFDWMKQQYGEGIVKYFMLPYNEKMWTVHPRELTTDWISRFVPKPRAEEILIGATSRKSENTGYNVKFLYPKNGISDLVQKYLSPNLKLNSEVHSVDIQNKIVYAGETKYEYDILINTSPLKDFVLNTLSGIPQNIIKNGADLRSSNLLYFNISWKGGLGKNIADDTQWLYFPEGKYKFYRVGFPTNISAALAPSGYSNCYVEISYPENSFPDDDQIPQVSKEIVASLIEAAIVPEDFVISNIQHGKISPSYVIYDSKWQVSRQNIFEYFSEQNILTGGRYGAWEYSSMEDAILWGKRLAKTCLK